MRAAVLVVLALTGLVWARQWRAFDGEITQFRDLRRQAAMIQRTIAQSYPQCTVVHSYPSSSPAFALSFGTHWDRNLFRDQLATQFPGFLDIWDGPQGWVGPVSWDELLNDHSCVLVRGSGDSSGLKLAPGLSTKTLVAGSESLLLIERTPL
jgi:hypothetical protein